MPNRHPITGCRHESIFGLWLCPAQDLEPLRDAAWSIVSQGDSALARCSQESKDQEKEKKPYSVEDGIAHISLSGPMTKYPTSFGSLFGGTSTIQMRESLRQIRQDPSIKGVMLHCDSPGGTADGTAELAASIRQLNDAKPVFVHAEDKMTSGALWAGSQGARVTCGPTAWIGSLGTMLMLYDDSKAVEAVKGKPVLVVTGEHKGIGASGNPVTSGQKAELQGIVNAINKPFQQEVFQARPQSKDHHDEILTARVFIGDDALRVGLVDEICTSEEALTCLQEFVSKRQQNQQYQISHFSNDLKVKQTSLLSQQKNVKVASRDPALTEKPVASKRSKLMPLTVDQLKVAQALPGGSGITEENADVVLFQVASTLQSNLTVQKSAVQEATTKIHTLELQVSDLKSKVPVQMDPSLAQAKAELAIERVSLMQEKGLVLPTQVAKLNKAFLNEGKPNEIFLNDVVQKTVFDILSDNKPNGLLKEISKGQPAPRVTPGLSSDKEKVPPTFSEINNVRQLGGLDPYTPQQYQAKYGVSPANA